MQSPSSSTISNEHQLVRSTSLPQTHLKSCSSIHPQSPVLKKLQKMHNQEMIKQELQTSNQIVQKLYDQNTRLHQELQKIKQENEQIIQKNNILGRQINEKDQNIRELEKCLDQENQHNTLQIESIIREKNIQQKRRIEEIRFLEDELKNQIQKREQIIKLLEEQLEEERQKNGNLILSMNLKINNLQSENNELQKQLAESQLSLKQFKENIQNDHKYAHIALQDEKIEESAIKPTRIQTQIDTVHAISNKQQQIARLKALIQEEKERNRITIETIIEEYEALINPKQYSETDQKYDYHKQQKDLKIIKNSVFSISNNEDFEIDVPNATPLKQQLLEIVERQSKEGLKMRHSLEFDNKSGFSEKYFCPEQNFLYNKYEISSKIEQQEELAESLPRTEPKITSEEKNKQALQHQEIKYLKIEQESQKSTRQGKFGTLSLLSIIASIPLAVYAIKKIIQS